MKEKTVDVQGIQERFKSLNINVNWKKLNEVQTYRNNIEHYYATASPGSVQKMISDSFIVIVNFIQDHLEEDPRELLGLDTYEVMRSIDEVYEADKAICLQKLKSLNYFTNTIYEILVTTTCSGCSSGLITSSETNVDACDTDYICRSCNRGFDYENLVTKAFEKNMPFLLEILQMAQKIQVLNVRNVMDIYSMMKEFASVVDMKLV